MILNYTEFEKMKEKFHKIHLMSIFLSLALFSSFFLAISNYYYSQNHWGIKIDNKIMNKTTSDLMIDLEHQYGDQLPDDLVIRINKGNGKTKVQPISHLNNKTLKHNISISEKGNNFFLESKYNIKVRANGRLLQQTDQNPPSFSFISTFIKYFFCIFRNLAIISAATATFDLWMPLLMFIETFLCLGYWTHNAHYFTIMYKEIYNCKFDLFNLVRIFITSQSEPSTNQYLANYGLTDKFALNCSGELCFYLVLIFLTILIKILGLFVKSQRLRLISAKLKPIWNGYMFWMTPKILSLAGLSLRLAPENPSGAQILHLVLAAVGIVIMILYFALLIIQVRKISSKLEYIEESRLELGIAGRIDYMKDFQFDCLQYSMLYYPSMNLGRLIFAHLCLGFAPDFHYVQYGGVIAAHVIYMMVQISSSGYKTKRNKLVYPIIDFLYVVFFLAFIGVGLIYGVGHLELTLKLETVGFSLIFAMTLILILMNVLDIIEYCRNEYNSTPKTFNSRKELSSQCTNNQYLGKTEDFGQTKSTQKDYIRPQEQGSESVESISKPKDKGFSSKIKKVKNGKVM